MAFTVRSVIFDIIGRDNASKAFLTASRNAELAANRFDRSMYRMEASALRFQRVGKTLSRAITLPVAAVAAYSVVTAAKFEKSLTLLETATGEAHKNLKIVGDGIQKIAVETGTSLDQLGQGMYLVEKAGYRGAKGLRVLGAAAKGAKAENVDLSVATDALTSVMKSYQLGADKAVAVENALIRGSGLAKTTMNDFAGSLSNVVPLAGALKISIPEIFADIATMTQHGETAQRSTENLANLITNLAGQNNVASQAMQQLDINVLSVQKDLGKRGLSGTLMDVVQHMRDHAKGGQIVYDSLKRAALGEASLGTMIKSMSGALKLNSVAFRDGKMSATVYRKYMMSLGGQAHASAKDFYGAVRSIMGFNNNLKSGKGNVVTATKALQTMLGGVTGMKAALMLLGGEFMHTNKGAKTLVSISDQINKAMHNKNGIVGWPKTLKLASVQWDQLKEKIQVTAAKIGAVLLPVGKQLIQWIGNVIDWFNKLSPAQKAFAKWIILIGALLGPAIAILSRLTRGFAILFRVLANVGRFRAGLMAMRGSLMMMGTTAYQQGARTRTALVGTGVAATESAATVARAEVAQTAAVRANVDAQIVMIERLRATMGAPLLPMPVGRSMPLVPPTTGRLGSLRALGSPALGLALGIGLPIAGSKVGGTGGSMLTGAGYGAMAGSFLGGPGMLIGAGLGAAIGGLMSMFGGGHKTTPGKWQPNWHNVGSAGSIFGGGKGMGAMLGSLKTLADNAKIATKAEKLLSRATDSTGHIMATTARKIVAAALRMGGLSKEAAKYKVSTGELTTAITGTNKQYERMRNMLGLAGASSAFLAGMDQIRASFYKSTGAAKVMQNQIDTLQKRINSIKQGNVPSIAVNTDQAASAIASLQSMINYLNGQINSLNGTDISFSTNTQSVASANSAELLHQLQLGNITQAQFDKRFQSGTRTDTKIKVSQPHKVYGGAGGAGDTGGGGSGSSGSTPTDPRVAARQAIGPFLAAARAWKSTAGDLRSVAHALLVAAKQGKVAADLQTKLAADAKTLQTLGKERDRITSKLLPRAQQRLASLRSKRQALINDTSNTFTGAVDITTIGQDSWGVSQTGNIVTRIMKMAADAKKFVRVIHTLTRRGLPRALILQLIQAGPSALGAAQALMAATPDQFKSIKTAYGSLRDTGRGLGKTLGDDWYGAGIKSAERLVEGLKSRRSLLNKAIRGLATQMVIDLEHALHMKELPSLSKAHKYGAHEAAMEQHFHIHGITDPEAFARAVARRLAQMVA